VLVDLADQSARGLREFRPFAARRFLVELARADCQNGVLQREVPHDLCVDRRLCAEIECRSNRTEHPPHRHRV